MILRAVSVLSIGSLAVYGASSGPSSGILNSNAGLVALALVNAMGISGHMSWLVNSCTCPPAVGLRDVAHTLPLLPRVASQGLRRRAK